MDPSVVVRAQHGDEGAFAALVEASIGRLNATARLVMRDASSAEEAVQEALVSAWRDLPRLREPERFDAWLRRLLVRACFDLHRRDRRRRVTEILQVGDGPTARDEHGAIEARERLERALAPLSMDHRVALVLTYYLDLPLADSAAILGIPQGTMKSRLDRARSALRASLEAQERSPVRSQEALA